MFGRVDEIRREFPAYRLIYRECEGPGLTENFSLISGGKGWSGNVFDFYFIVYDRIAGGCVCRERRSDGTLTGKRMLPEKQTPAAKRRRTRIRRSARLCGKPWQTACPTRTTMGDRALW